MPVCLPVIHACFGAVTVELNNHDKGWLAKPEAFTVWTFTENVSRALVLGTWVLGGGAGSRWVKEGFRPPRGAGGVIPGVAVLIRPGAPGQTMLHPVTRTRGLALCLRLSGAPKVSEGWWTGCPHKRTWVSEFHQPWQVLEHMQPRDVHTPGGEKPWLQSGQGSCSCRLNNLSRNEYSRRRGEAGIFRKKGKCSRPSSDLSHLHTPSCISGRRGREQGAPLLCSGSCWGDLRRVIQLQSLAAMLRPPGPPAGLRLALPLGPAGSPGPRGRRGLAGVQVPRCTEGPPWPWPL